MRSGPGMEHGGGGDIVPVCVLRCTDYTDVIQYRVNSTQIEVYVGFKLKTT